MPSTTTVKARYLGPVLLSGPGDPASMDNAVKRLRASAQVARASVHISNESVKITDRAGKDVLLLAERENICCHGMQPNSTTFLCLVVDQNSRYYCHVINMPKSEASKACRALVDCFGGGDGEIVPSWKSKNKKRLRQSVKPGRRRSSISAAPSNGFDEHATRSVASPRAVVVSAEQLARERETFPRKFVGMYLGAQPVDALFGADVIRKAVEENGQERLRQHMADTTAGFGDPVTVIVSTQNVRTMDRTTGSVMMSEFIKNISYTSVLDSVDGNDVFAFIAVNKRIGGIHCHIYHVPRGQGQLAYMAVETAFKLLAADEKAIGDNPFAVTDPKREPAPAILFKHQIHRADLKALQQIGAGQFGAVYTAYQYTRVRAPNTLVAASGMRCARASRLSTRCCTTG
ncbi:hypothetical protein PTSG_03439 [Salpingoeca rosetta]|uniref:PID domain-containing protein n=1 Tax=Salpingoeca rosetta (strain ATCC 50818 / BSB-021) TaxID=946362 RepID=F2U573_SALR5|nr:uncharacterized protein PTSG_03439 [Salpingoeca rosetta]EGD82789.1 hypothetical protein PTSG_03439 [Salpingoeca rosetta]|eukprot:XP_004996025.1 hypothetical protein PTSG_03439 [Salpingoeca rosetta]